MVSHKRKSKKIKAFGQSDVSEHTSWRGLTAPVNTRTLCKAQSNERRTKSSAVTGTWARTGEALAAPAAQQKGTILESRGGQADATLSTTEDARASSGVIMCILCADSAQPSYRSASSPCIGESAIRVGADTKKMYIPPWKYTIISHAMSIRLVEGG
jgi:hypothetical protein